MGICFFLDLVKDDEVRAVGILGYDFMFSYLYSGILYSPCCGVTYHRMLLHPVSQMLQLITGNFRAGEDLPSHVF